MSVNSKLLAEKYQFLSQATKISAVNKLSNPWEFDNRLSNSRGFDNWLSNRRGFDNQITPEIIVALQNIGFKYYNKRNYVTIPYNRK